MDKQQATATEGEYKNFTGTILVDGMKAEVEDADFVIRAGTRTPVIFKAGKWKTGRAVGCVFHAGTSFHAKEATLCTFNIPVTGAMNKCVFSLGGKLLGYALQCAFLKGGTFDGGLARECNFYKDSSFTQGTALECVFHDDMAFHGIAVDCKANKPSVKNGMWFGDCE